jgi:hypothetical protein
MMNRRDFLKVLSYGAASIVLTKRIGRANPSEKKPNIIFIMADDMGY